MGTDKVADCIMFCYVLVVKNIVFFKLDVDLFWFKLSANAARCILSWFGKNCQ